jgi:hypothetical protein
VKAPPVPTHPALAALGEPARDPAGAPTLNGPEATFLLRHHLDLEKLRTTDYDVELWALWRQEVDRAGPEAHNADVLDRVLARIRDGE